MPQHRHAAHARVGPILRTGGNFTDGLRRVHCGDAVQSSAALKSPIFGRTPGNCSTPHRFEMNCRIDVVSYVVWSTKPFFTCGPINSVGMRVPGPKRSPQPGPVGGGTWSQ